MTLQEITPDLATQFGSTTGALVADVKAGTPADKAGIQSGDVIKKMNGQVVEDFHQLRLAISALPPGTTITLDLLRNGTPKTVTVKLGNRSEAGMAGENGNTGGAPGSDTGVL